MDDNALIATYLAFDTPVDHFIGDPELAEAFAAEFRGRVEPPEGDPAELMNRLLYLRKRGRLPRLRRNYFGRNASTN